MADIAVVVPLDEKPTGRTFESHRAARVQKRREKFDRLVHAPRGTEAMV